MYISRSDEAAFPNFKTLEEARSYFRKQYGSLYNEGYSEWLDEDQRCYFDDVGGQPVQISVYTDGFVSVHVVY